MRAQPPHAHAGAPSAAARDALLTRGRHADPPESCEHVAANGDAHAPRMSALERELRPVDDNDPYVKKWCLHVRQNEELGKYLAAGLRIPSGQLAMVLPPNKIYQLDEVPDEDQNQVLQVSEDKYSSSVADTDYDCFLSHSCEPNLRVDILDDYTVNLWALRDIAEHEPLTFDYETTEYDMVPYMGDFLCNCHSPKCRGRVRGYKYRAVYDGEPAPAWPKKRSAAHSATIAPLSDGGKAGGGTVACSTVIPIAESGRTASVGGEPTAMLTLPDRSPPATMRLFSASSDDLSASSD